MSTEVAHWEYLCGGLAVSLLGEAIAEAVWVCQAGVKGGVVFVYEEEDAVEPWQWFPHVR